MTEVDFTPWDVAVDKLLNKISIEYSCPLDVVKETYKTHPDCFFEKLTEYKNHMTKDIDIKELQDFVSEHPGVMFTRTNTKALFVGVGCQNYSVYKIDPNISQWDLVHVGVQPFPALDVYNNLP